MRETEKMTDPFASDSGIGSPAHESLKNVDGCYNKNILKSKSFANSRRALQSGAEKISRTFRSMRNTFGNLSQVTFDYTKTIDLLTMITQHCQGQYCRTRCDCLLYFFHNYNTHTAKITLNIMLNSISDSAVGAGTDSPKMGHHVRLHLLQLPRKR